MNTDKSTDLDGFIPVKSVLLSVFISGKVFGQELRQATLFEYRKLI